MNDRKPPETKSGPRATDPTTELYRRAIERADEPKRGRTRKQKKAPSDGQAIAELGDEVGGPA